MKRIFSRRLHTAQVSLTLFMLLAQMLFPIVAFAQSTDNFGVTDSPVYVIDNEESSNTVEPTPTPNEPAITDNMDITGLEPVINVEDLKVEASVSKTQTFSDIEVGVRYEYSLNNKVGITFSMLPEGSNEFSVEEVTAYVDGAVETGYEFKTNMTDGTFTYVLELPNTAGAGAEIMYSEDGKSYSDVADEMVTSDVIRVELNHFTTFVVISPNPVGNGNTATDATCTTAGIGPTCYDSISAALTAAIAGDTIVIAPGTYTLTGVLNVNKTNITITGSGVGSTIIQGSIATGANFFSVTATGFTLENVELVKTDKAGVQNLIYIGASNTTVRNTAIHGQYAIGDGDVSRAMVVSGGLSGLQIEGNTIYSLRQPGYFSGTTTGNITNNYVYGTKGWVMEGGDMTFTNNTWGSGSQTNVYDIAILATVPAGAYSDITAISAANNGAVIEDQRVSPAVLSAVYVDASTAYTTDLGGKFHPYSSIAPALTRVVDGGVIYIAAGTYIEQITINKNLSIVGSGVGSTLIQAPSVLSDTSLGANTKTIVFITNNKAVEISNLTVAGPGPSNCGSIHYGIFIAGNSMVSLDNLAVNDIRDNPASGCQNGVGIMVGRQALGQIGTAYITNSTVSNYQKGGIVVDNTGSSALIDNVTVTGLGEVNFIAQNGIQISRGATASVSNTSVSGNSFNNPSNPWHRGSAGILLYQAGDNVTLTNNSISGNDSGLYAYNVETNPTVATNIFASNVWNVTWDDADNVDLRSNIWSGLTTLDSQEASINHNCAASTFPHGTCTSDDFASGGYSDFWVDVYGPSAPVNGAPNGSLLNTNDFWFTWDAVTDTSSPVTYEFQASMNSAEVDGVLTTGLWHSGILTTPTIHSTGAPDGTWYWQVRAIDSAGNMGDWSTIWTVTLDTTHPAAPTITAPTGDYYKTSPILNSWTVVTDASGIAYYRVEYVYDDGHSFPGMPYRTTTSTSRNHSPNIGEQGGVSFRVQAFDNAGNEGVWSAWKHYYYDATAPVTSVSGIDSILHNSDVTLNFGCTDYPTPYGSGCANTYYYVDGVLNTGLTALLTTDGMHTIAYYSEDNVGNVEELVVSTQTVNIDKTAPDVEITSPTSTYIRGSVPIRGTVTDANPHHYWLVIQRSGGSNVAGPGTVNDATSFTDKLFFNWNTTAVADGTYIVKLEARDAANNKDTGSVDWNTVIVDNTAPVITVDPYNTDPTNQNITVTASAGTDMLNTTSHTFTENGSFDFVATDLAGNTTTVTVTITNINKVAPVLTVPANITQEAVSGAGNVVNFVVSATDDVTASPVIVCDHTSGETFPVANTTVTCTATDDHGNTDTKSFNINIVDTTRPVMGPTPNIVREATGPSAAVVTFNITATDIVDGIIPAVCTPASGSTFALSLLGTRVTCTATDSHGNSRTASFRVFVLDRTAPSFGATPNITGIEATGPSGAIVTYSVSATDIVSGNITPICLPASGRTFRIGTTTVVCMAMDSWFNTSFRTFTITVSDTTAPVVTVPANKIVPADAITGKAIVDFSSEVSALDIVSGSLPVTCDPASGSEFTVGTTTVNCSATDAAGNPGTNSFTITVEDKTGPVITAPEDITVEATSPLGYLYSFNASALDNVDTEVSVNCYPTMLEPTSYSPMTVEEITSYDFTYQLPLGENPIICTSSDSAGNYTDYYFTVIVRDITPPELNLPDDMVLEATSSMGAVAFFEVTATDNVDESVSPECSATSGDTFPIGETIVICSAMDDYENRSDGSFKVTVLDTTNPTIAMHANEVRTTNSLAGIVVNYTKPEASDAVGPAVTVNCTPASGSLFPVGSSTVTCTAADGAGNTASTTFTVTVNYVAPIQPQIAGEDTTPTPTLTPTQKPGTVLGLASQQCPVAYGATGYLYIDANSNNTLDDGEKKVGNTDMEVYVPGVVQTDNTEKDITVFTIKSDSDGKWSANLCPGDYKVRINGDVYDLKVNNADTNQNINIAVKNVTIPGFNWWLLVLIAGGFGALVYILRKRSAQNLPIYR